MKRKFLPGGVIVVVMAVASGFIQSTFYGYVDANGVLRDSLFLPLTFIFGFSGIIIIAGAVLLGVRK